MSEILLPPEVTEDALAQDGPRTQEASEDIKTLTILWDSKRCQAVIKHDPDDWHCWAGIAGVLEAAKETAKLNYSLWTTAMIQQQQQAIMQRQQMAGHEIARIRELGQKMGESAIRRRNK